MATYAIGDIQGCFESLCRLLERIAFDPERDRLWLCGDLVNRGPQSLEVLRWARAHEESLEVVLGNHDLHLLAVHFGVRALRPADTMQAILAAPDREELIQWLCARRLFYRGEAHAMVHAGLLPGWSLADAERLAAEVEAVLRSADAALALAASYGARLTWCENLVGHQRVAALMHAFAFTRCCDERGALAWGFAGPPEAAPDGMRPWYSFARPDVAEATVVFGHWAALGYRRVPGAVCLDSGCVWGGALTAYRFEDGAVFQQPSVEARAEGQNR